MVEEEQQSVFSRTWRNARLELAKLSWLREVGRLRVYDHGYLHKLKFRITICSDSRKWDKALKQETAYLIQGVWHPCPRRSLYFSSRKIIVITWALWLWIWWPDLLVRSRVISEEFGPSWRTERLITFFFLRSLSHCILLLLHTASYFSSWPYTLGTLNYLGLFIYPPK